MFMFAYEIRTKSPKKHIYTLNSTVRNESRCVSVIEFQSVADSSPLFTKSRLSSDMPLEIFPKECSREQGNIFRNILLPPGHCPSKENYFFVLKCFFILFFEHLFKIICNVVHLRSFLISNQII